MKITKAKLQNIIKEELDGALNDSFNDELAESESIGETVDALEKNITAAMDNMKRLALHLKQSGMDPKNVEMQMKSLEDIIGNLNQALQPIDEVYGGNHNPTACKEAGLRFNFNIRKCVDKTGAVRTP